MKDASLIDMSAHYLKLLKYTGIDCEVRTLKGFDDPTADTALLIEKLADMSPVFLLSEGGKIYSSTQFSSLFKPAYEGTQKVTLALAGPFGWDYDLIPPIWHHLSLSPLTFTHELAYVLLLEQLYRGAKIMKRQKYHY